MMWYPFLFALTLSTARATILQNGQVRPNNYTSTAISAITASDKNWRTYPPSAQELSYKGRWDDQYISWWTAPGLKFGFQAESVALSFGAHTTDGVLLAYRLDGQDWALTNVTANSTQLLIEPSTVGYNLTSQSAVKTLEVRVTNWAYGVQLSGVHLSGRNSTLVRIPDYKRTMEFIGDSLSAGQYATLEGISSNPWALMYGLGNVEFSISAYPGICLHDSRCYGKRSHNLAHREVLANAIHSTANMHGQTYQWLRTSDTSGRALDLYGDNPPLWNFTAHSAADITLINIGTNDNNPINNITSAQFTQSYIDLITTIHTTWPSIQIIVLSLWGGFSPSGATYTQTGAFGSEIESVVKHFNNGSLNSRGECKGCYVYYFDTTGILQKNDIGPQYHPTDVGHIKLASHLMQYVKLVFGWELEQTGPEVLHETLYW
jgi:hypothetical protein